MLRACAPISRATDGLIMAEAVAMALAEEIGKSGPSSGGAASKNITEKRPARTADKGPEGYRPFERGRLAKLFEPMAYQGASQA
jgi:3-carboxy-cis,cis-muconate cycloisomerase